MATEHISREAAWNGIYNCPTKRDADGYIWVRTVDVAHMIDDIPPANVRPVAHGEWWPAKDGYYSHVMCSECHKIESHQTDFCPNCGADMRRNDE